MPQTTVLVCLLKRVVALAEEKMWQSRQSWQQVKTVSREKKIRTGSGTTINAVVVKQITDTAYTEAKKIAGREKPLQTFHNMLVLPPLRLAFL